MNQQTSIDSNQPGTSLLVLANMKPGMQGHVVGFETPDVHADMADRLREMGFAEDLDIEVLHESPFGRDPIAVRVGRMTIALRRKEAHYIKVQLV